jgi:hypothetical protein
MNEVNGVRFDEEWAVELERAIDEEFSRLFLAEEESGDVVDLAGEPWCGCYACERRIVLAITVRAALDGAKEGRVELA